MHSKRCSGGTQFFLNGDFSGDLIIAKDGLNDGVVIPCKDILELVALEYVLPRAIGRLEEMESSELLEHLLQNLG